MVGLRTVFNARLIHGIIAGLLLFSLAPPGYCAQLVLLDQYTQNILGTDISYDGQVVVSTGSTSTPPTYWTPTQGFVQVPGRTGNFIGISGDGSTMVGGSTGDSFRYSIATGYSDMPNMAGATNTISLSPNALSDNGSIATGVEYTGTVNGLVWDANGDPTRLALTSQGRDISGDGTVVVGISRGPVSEGGSLLADQATRWVWNGGTQAWVRTVLTTGSGDTGAAFAVSQDGNTVFGTDPNNRAFRWTSTDGLLDLDAGFTDSAIYAATTDGIFGGGMFNTGSGSIAAIWDQANGWRTLASLLLAAGMEESGIPDFRAVAAMSADGQYLAATSGSGTNAGLHWVDLGSSLTTVPLPAGAWLFLSGLLSLAGLARRDIRPSQCVKGRR